MEFKHLKVKTKKTKKPKIDDQGLQFKFGNRFVRLEQLSKLFKKREAMTIQDFWKAYRIIVIVVMTPIFLFSIYYLYVTMQSKPVEISLKMFNEDRRMYVPADMNAVNNRLISEGKADIVIIAKAPADYFRSAEDELLPLDYVFVDFYDLDGQMIHNTLIKLETSDSKEIWTGEEYMTLRKEPYQKSLKDFVKILHSNKSRTSGKFSRKVKIKGLEDS